MSNKSDGRDFEQNITADPSGFIKGFDQAKQAAVQTSATIDAQFKKIGDRVMAVSNMLVGFATVLAGGGALKKFITDANEWNGTAGRMAVQLDLTTQRASVLNVALARLGMDSDLYLGASQKLSKQIQSNAQAFEVMGIKVRDSSGAYRPVTELMGEVNAKLIAIKNPIEQNIAGMQVYGKGWSEIRGILRLTAEQMNQAEVRARELGLIVGPEGVAMSKQYAAQMRDLTLVGKAMEVQFGNALLPVFSRIGEAMSRELPKSASLFGQVLGTVMETVTVLAANLQFVVGGIGRDLGAIAAGMAAVLTGDLAGAKAIHEMAIEDAKRSRAELDALEAKVLGVNARLQNVGQGSRDEDYGHEGRGSRDQGPRYKFKEKEEKFAADPSRMPQWETALAEKKVALEREALLDGEYRTMSKAAELSYWRELTKRKDLSDNERISVSRRTADVEMALNREAFDVRIKTLQAEAEQYKHNTDKRLEVENRLQLQYAFGTKEYEESQRRIVAIRRQADEQLKAIAQSRAEAERQAQTQTIALEEQTALQAEQLGLITTAQLLAKQAEFEERRYQIAFTAIQERLRLAEADPDRSPVEVERIHREIEQLEQQHQLRMGQIKGDQQLDLMAPQIEIFKSVQNTLSQTALTMVTNWRNASSALRSMFASIGSTMISELITKPAAAKVVAWLRERAMTLFGIGADAAKAGSGAAASQAGIPVVGPALALASMASVFAAVTAMGGNVPSFSAAKGFDIPGGVNPIIQAHAREMVLPEEQADVVRDMAGGGAGGPPIHLHTQGGDFVHKDDLVGLLRSLKRNFVII
nr:hypothetical protein [uncultured Roseateles sp.]